MQSADSFSSQGDNMVNMVHGSGGLGFALGLLIKIRHLAAKVTRRIHPRRAGSCFGQFVLFLCRVGFCSVLPCILNGPLYPLLAVLSVVFSILFSALLHIRPIFFQVKVRVLFNKFSIVRPSFLFLFFDVLVIVLSGFALTARFTVVAITVWRVRTSVELPMRFFNTTGNAPFHFS